MFECEKCGKVFQMKKYLNQHLRTHVKEFKSEFRCDKCDKIFQGINKILSLFLKHYDMVI